MADDYTAYSIHEPEELLQGIAASKGIVVGKAFVYSRDLFQVEKEDILPHHIESELARFQLALERSEKELSKIAGVTEQKVGDNYSQIFTAQVMMLHDEVLLAGVRRRIREDLRHASLAICEELSKVQQVMLASSETYFRERVDDIADLRERILRNLHDGQVISRIPEQVIVVSKMLTPADVILFSRQEMLACVVEEGGLTSHAALICQSLGIPMVVGVHQPEEKFRTGETIIVDGFNGMVFLNPAKDTLSQYARKQKRASASQTAMDKLSQLDAKTKCGKRIHLYSNIDLTEELPTLVKYGSEGIGLYRSEILFLSDSKQPSEAEQFDTYRNLAETIAPKPVTIRLFDIGGDKLLYASHKEANPNLGWRGVRILMDVPEILETQLRAILQANTHGNIRVMIPMIASLDEIAAVKKTLHHVIADLKHKRDVYNDKVQLGVMIEVPAAVELIEEILAEVDFVSIGTNDLIQYTLAVDRNNDIVQNLYNKFHPSIVRQLARVIRAAVKAKKPVSVCGEMASDNYALPLLLGLGLREFSVVNTSIPVLKKHLTDIRLADARKLAATCLTLTTAADIEQELKRFKSHSN
jgi:phosphoenolpyruvate-protein phosphotransferase (PTS system enzyme I)